MARQEVRTRFDDQDVDDFVRDIAQALPQNLKDKIEFKDPKALSKKEAQNLAARVLLGMFESPVYVRELAKACLGNPMAAAKLQVALVPKNVTIEETHKVQHTIVVPAMQTVDEWMQARGIAGSTVDELGFEHVTIEGEAHDNPER